MRTAGWIAKRTLPWAFLFLVSGCLVGPELYPQLVVVGTVEAADDVAMQDVVVELQVHHLDEQEGVCGPDDEETPPRLTASDVYRAFPADDGAFERTIDVRAPPGVYCLTAAARVTENAAEERRSIVYTVVTVRAQRRFGSPRDTARVSFEL